MGNGPRRPLVLPTERQYAVWICPRRKRTAGKKGTDPGLMARACRGQFAGETATSGRANDHVPKGNLRLRCRPLVNRGRRKAPKFRFLSARTSTRSSSGLLVGE